MFFASGTGSLAASVDLNDVHDPVGDLNQNLKVALGYKTADPLAARSAAWAIARTWRAAS